ncbi:MAG: hypothetical protein M3305_03910 [Actinomycetota bacterium]|nr:hypothetical protein [Actinomycetota bacterium]
MKFVQPMIAVLLLLASCGSDSGGGSSSEEETTTTPASSTEGTSAATEETATSTINAAATVILAAMNGSGAIGAATFTDVAEGVRVDLSVQRLPAPNATYLTHIHPGTCADEPGGEEEEDAHSEHAGTMAEIEYPLPPLSADSQGRGSTTAVLEDVTVVELFSGEPKYINIHAEGPGNPPSIACGQLGHE